MTTPWAVKDPPQSPIQSSNTCTVPRMPGNEVPDSLAGQQRPFGPMTCAFPILDLPSTCIHRVFEGLPTLQDAVALSRVCKQLHAHSADATYRCFACTKCKHPIFSPAAVFNSQAHKESPQLDLQDGDSYVALPTQLSGAVMSDEHSSHDRYLRSSLAHNLGCKKAWREDYGVKVQSVGCAGCGLYLGLRLVQLGKERVDHCSGTGLVLHATVLGRCWLLKRYLTLVRKDGSEDAEGVAGRVFCCTSARSRLMKPGQCGQELFEERAVLSKQHCWDAGGGVEPAFYVNHFFQGAVHERGERDEELCQGLMRVADVHCTRCGGRIGWKFCADLTEHENDNQVGRYGVVASAFD